MLTGPMNLIGTFSLVPIWEWERVRIANEMPPAASPTEPVECTAQANDAPLEEIQPEHFEMRLVFKGFGWRPGVEFATYPRPDWMAGLASGAEAAADPVSQEQEARRAEQNKRPSANRVDPKQHQPTTPNPAALDSDPQAGSD